MSAERPGPFRAVALLAVAGAGLVAYTYLTPPSVDPRLAAGLFLDLFILLRRAGGLP